MLQIALVAFGLAIILAAPAAAVTKKDAEACMGRDPSAAIAACSRILGGQEGATIEATAFLNRCNAYIALGDYERAVADCSAAVQGDPRAAKAYRGRGKAYLARSKYDLAIMDLRAAISLDPSYSLAYNDRGMAYAGLGDNRRALADLNKALELYPSAAVSYFNRALVLQRLGERGRALADARKALSMRPSDRDAQALVAQLESGAAPRPVPRPEPDAIAEPEVVEAEPEPQPEVQPPPKPKPVIVAKRPAPVIAEAQPATKPVPAPVQPKTEVKQAAKQPAAEVGAATLNGERRVALVIGNSGYKQVPRLPNPLRDAETIADMLRRLGFAEVRLVSDLDKSAMERTLLDFADLAQGADWAVVYFAGHGMEMDGVNYLVPTDARLLQDRHVKLETVSLDDVLEAAGGARTLRLVMLDACRENPFLNKMARTTATRSIGRGLARIEPTSGTLVAYAAMHGQVAEDGQGGNSPFVTALLGHIDERGLDIRLMFDKVRDSVLEATQNAQQPFTYGSLPGRVLSFNPAE